MQMERCACVRMPGERKDPEPREGGRLGSSLRNHWGGCSLNPYLAETLPGWKANSRGRGAGLRGESHCTCL